MRAEASGNDNQPHGDTTGNDDDVLNAYARRATGASTLDLLKLLVHSTEHVKQMPEPVHNEMLMQANAELDIQQSRKVRQQLVLVCACDSFS